MELPISEAEAMAACQDSLLDLGWSLLEVHDRAVVAREDATRLQQSKALARRIGLHRTAASRT